MIVISTWKQDNLENGIRFFFKSLYHTALHLIFISCIFLLNPAALVGSVAFSRA